MLSRRRDGYHELQSVVHTVGLWDTLTFVFKRGFDITCNFDHLANQENLCWKALRRWVEAAGDSGHTGFHGVQIHVEKRIPMGAGMGGGSGNAAATLLALNRYYNDFLNRRQLHLIAAKVGADVPLFLEGGCALMEGIGQKLSPLPTLSGWIVIVQPPQKLSTPAVFQAWDEIHHLQSPIPPVAPQKLLLTGAHTPQLLDCLRSGGLLQAATVLGNDLAPAALRLGLDTTRLKNLLLGHGALGAEMTGSGSAVFGLFESESAAHDAAARIETRREKLGLSFVAAIPLCDKAVRFSEAP